MTHIKRNKNGNKCNKRRPMNLMGRNPSHTWHQIHSSVKGLGDSWGGDPMSPTPSLRLAKLQASLLTTQSTAAAYALCYCVWIHSTCQHPLHPGLQWCPLLPFGSRPGGAYFSAVPSSAVVAGDHGQQPLLPQL